MNGRPGVAFGQLVQRSRLAAGLTQQALADRSGLSVRGISDLERGLKSRPRPYTVRMLADALGLGVEDRAAFFLAADARPVAPGFHLGRVTPRVTVRPRLPRPGAPLFGRDDDLAAIDSLLSGGEARLVTLTGPGGSGRTRIALEAGHRAAARFRDGVAFAPLSAARHPSLVPSEIAFAFGLRALDGPEPIESLVAALQDLETLVLVDDADPAVAGECIAALLARCPSLTMLATGPAPLGIEGERSLPARPLPQADVTSPVDGAADGSPAVRLFLAAAGPDAAGSPDGARAALAIARAAAGMPLAIELAAARAGEMPLDVLAERFPAAVTAPDPGAAMGQAVAWSAGLLTAAERSMLQRLSVFQGGFTYEGAHAVAGLPGTSPGRTFELVESLAAARLLTRQPAPAGPRMAMPGPVADIAAEWLAASGDRDEIRGRHLAWAIAAAERLGDRIFFPPTPDDPGQHLFDADLANLRAALEWAEASGNGRDGMRLLGGAWFPLSLRGLSREGFAWARRFVPDPLMPPEEADFAPMGLIGAGWIGALAGSGGEAEAFARLGLARALAAEPDLAPLASMVISFCLSAQRCRAEAIAAAEEAFARAAGPPASRWLAIAANRLGVALENAGDAAGSVPPFERALAIWRRHSFRWGLATARNNLTDALFQAGEWSRAARLHREVIADEAAGVAPSDPWVVLRSWLGLVEIALAAGDYRLAALMFGSGERYREEQSLVLPPDERAARAAAEERLRTLAGPAAASQWIAEGRSLATADALAMSETP